MQIALATDQVNAQLGADFAALSCPTVFLLAGGPHSDAPPERTRRIHTAAEQAAAGNPQVTVVATTTGHPARILTRDAGLVAAAIDEAARRLKALVAP
ncbi:hypothetical protein [Kitasatospora sp. NPDC050543]|uniref:hypothetical protein n=1 Tax=Kitasatospora sp. NPDC050543 TaxID=3364054 RepID=UPI0037AC40F6